MQHIFFANIPLVIISASEEILQLFSSIYDRPASDVTGSNLLAHIAAL